MASRLVLKGILGEKEDEMREEKRQIVENGWHQVLSALEVGWDLAAWLLVGY